MLCGDPRRIATPISPPATKAKSALLERIGIRREKKDVKFILANGQEVTRSVGFAIIRLDKYFTMRLFSPNPAISRCYA
jgi:hypothetical protein